MRTGIRRDWTHYADQHQRPHGPSYMVGRLNKNFRKEGPVLPTSGHTLRCGTIIQ